MVNTAIFDENDNRIDSFQSRGRLGCDVKLACRLLWTGFSDEQTSKRRRQIRAFAKRQDRTPSQARLQLAKYNLLVTNVEQSMLSASQAFVLYRIR